MHGFHFVSKKLQLHHKFPATYYTITYYFEDYHENCCSCIWYKVICNMVTIWNLRVTRGLHIWCHNVKSTEKIKCMESHWSWINSSPFSYLKTVSLSSICIIHMKKWDSIISKSSLYFFSLFVTPKETLNWQLLFWEWLLPLHVIIMYTYCTVQVNSFAWWPNWTH